MRLGVPLGAVVARHLLALDDTRRIGAWSDRARSAVLRVAVGVRTAAEAPARHDALEAAPLRRPSHLHLGARREDPDVHDIADLVRRDLGILAGRVIETNAADNLRGGREAGLGGVSARCLVGPAASWRPLLRARLATETLLAVAELH